MKEYLWLIVALPFVGSLVLAVAGGKISRLASAITGVGTVTLSAVLSIFIGLDFLNNNGTPFNQTLWQWIDVAGLSPNIAFHLDSVSMTFIFVITFVGALIHLYSAAFMWRDEGFVRFFAFMNLFIGFMLILVLADNFLFMYLGWEGVGLCSFLLIGFWYKDPLNGHAARKAFIVTRVGDTAMAIGLFILFMTYHTLNIQDILANAPNTWAVGSGIAMTTAFLLLGGALGKSAQLPLQTWLPDAMAAPSPVSALSHAATMVTAGVYLVVRSHVIFEASPTAQMFVVIVGAITLLFGAIVGCAKDDIKKALAASTMSQIGYMMLAAGLGPVGYAFAIFHLLNHGFFKAGMFLGAGSVMHGMDDQVDMRRFGNLSGAMKITWVTFGLGWLAILGVPPFSGFWSKDKIIEAAFIGDGWRPWIFGFAALIGAGVTAFYMSRLFFMTFHGKKRWPKDAHPHESPRSMTVPMVVLAAGSAFLGLILGPTGAIQSWLEPVVGVHVEGESPVIAVPVLTTLTLLVVAAGLGLAWMRYWREEVPVGAPVGSLPTRAARQDLFQDAVNEAVLMRPGLHLTRSLVFFDNKGVDGAVGSVAALIGGSSSRLRRVQNGFVRSYALTMLFGVVVILGAVWVVQ